MSSTAESRRSYSVLESIRAQLGQLPPGEERVAKAILDQPYSSMTWSAKDLAEQAGTSSPTVVRACRRLGFDGLPQMRLALAREIGWSRIATEAPPAGAGDVLRDMFDSTLRAAATIGEHVDVDAFTGLVNLVDEGRRIVFVCVGATQIVCLDAVFDLVSIGKPAEFASDAAMQRLVASRMSHGDVCIAVGVSGENQLTIDAAVAARDAGATVVAVTTSPRSTLAKAAHAVVSLGTPGVQPHSGASLMAMLVLFRAITASVAARADKPLPPDVLSVMAHHGGRPLGRG